MVDSTIFIGTVIIAVVQIIKYFVPAVAGVVTILVAAIVGGIVGIIDTSIGVTNITVAQGILIGLGSAGVVYTAGRINGTK